MTKYSVTETRPVWITDWYEVDASSEEEAIGIVESTDTHNPKWISRTIGEFCDGTEIITESHGEVL